MLREKSVPNTEIRRLLPDDRLAWEALWTSYLEFYETTLPSEIHDTAFERLLCDDRKEFQGLVAEQDGKLVGLAHFLFHRSLWSVEDTCYLMDLFVDPVCRGAGIGRALVEAVHAEAKSSGITVTYWQTEESNYKGRMLYDQIAQRTPFIVYEKTE